MRTQRLQGTTTTQAVGSQRKLLLAMLTAAIFLSAALLFAVQPMFTKMVLPKLGGAPSVWSIAMVFFQAALLAGYAYAHFLTRFVPGRRALLIHLAVMTLACLLLPAISGIAQSNTNDSLQQVIDQHKGDSFEVKHNSPRA